MALAIYPLAIPKIAGPGAMLTVVLLTDDDRLNIVGMRTVAFIAVVLVIQLLILLAAVPDNARDPRRRRRRHRPRDGHAAGGARGRHGALGTG